MFLIEFICPFLLHHLVGQVNVVELLLLRVIFLIQQFNSCLMLLVFPFILLNYFLVLVFHFFDLHEILLNFFIVLVFNFLNLLLLQCFLSAVFCFHLIDLVFLSAVFLCHLIKLCFFLQVVVGHLLDRVLQLKYPLIGILGLKHGSLVEESEVGDGILENLCEELVTEVEEILTQILFCLLQFSV